MVQTLPKSDCELDEFAFNSQSTIKNMSKLEILVENPGRVNFSVLDDERKGVICAPVICAPVICAQL